MHIKQIGMKYSNIKCFPLDGEIMNDFDFLLYPPCEFLLSLSEQNIWLKIEKKKQPLWSSLQIYPQQSPILPSS